MAHTSNRWSAEARAKHSIAQTGPKNHMWGKHHHHTEETKAKQRANNAMKRPEVVAKIRAGWTPTRRAEAAVAMTGDKNPMKRPEVAAKSAASKIGKKRPPFSAEWTANMSVAHMGPKNYRWKGGITPERIRVNHQPEYAAWRKAVFGRDDHTCQVCGTRGGDLEAHHIIWWSQCHDLVCDVHNGLTVCATPCHDLLHAASMRLAG